MTAAKKCLRCRKPTPMSKAGADNPAGRICLKCWDEMSRLEAVRFGSQHIAPLPPLAPGRKELESEWYRSQFALMLDKIRRGEAKINQLRTALASVVDLAAVCHDYGPVELHELEDAALKAQAALKDGGTTEPEKCAFRHGRYVCGRVERHWRHRCICPDTSAHPLTGLPYSHHRGRMGCHKFVQPKGKA